MKRALIVVDVQRDFCDGGALAAGDTMSLLQPLRAFIEKARSAGITIVFTQDWHPAAHSSFQGEGGRWPVHCVAASRGAQLMPPIEARDCDLIVRKGCTVVGAGYSGFEGTEMAEQLHALDILEVAVCGIATEYCVRATAMDAANTGFRVAVLKDLIRAVDPSAGKTALREMVSLAIASMSSIRWLDGRQV